MAELFEAIASWPTFLLVLLVFGLAPGVVLRIFVCCYPKGDPRRKELVADLYAMPSVRRPLWVTTQVETALFEGLSGRWAARDRLPSSFMVVRLTAALSGAAIIGWTVAVIFSALPPYAKIASAIAMVGALLWIGRSHRRAARMSAAQSRASRGQCS